MSHDSSWAPQLPRCGREIQTVWLQSCLGCKAIRFPRDSWDGTGKERHRNILRALFGKSKAATFFVYCQNTWIKRKSEKGNLPSGHDKIMFTITSAFYAVVLGCQMWRQSSQREIHKPHFPHLDLKTAPKLQDIKPTTLRASPGMLGTTLKNHL